MSKEQELRPAYCRNRLQAEGKPYPRSGCAARSDCKFGNCPYEKLALQRTETPPDVVEAVWQELARHGYLLDDDARDALAKALSAPRTDDAAQPRNDVGGWKPMSNTAWLDGRNVVLLAHGMEVSARYCAGEWSEDTHINPREYSGAVWSCFDDEFQFEIEEVSKDPSEWSHHPATHWREPSEIITAPQTDDQTRDAVRKALRRQCDNMAFAINHFDIPSQWYSKFRSELAADRHALAQTDEQPEPAEGLAATASSMVANTEVEQFAIDLMLAWAAVDANSVVSRHPASFIATFMDVARATFPALTKRDDALEEAVVAAYRQGWFDCKDSIDDATHKDAMNEGAAQYQTNIRALKAGPQ